MIHNTGPIIGKHVCEYTGNVEIIRKLTTRDKSLAMERAALEKKMAEKAMAESDRSCDES